ncbi:hypothetical protein, partial [Streptococcus pneumoniae]|uniref:hypothetical protein n=1 Tax=Streptococcus pneumoniae TaxID=1313 RepID=UPI0018B04FDB
KKNHLRDVAATQVKAALEAHYGRHPTEANSRELAGKMLEMWQSKAQQIGPQSNAGGVAPNLGPGVIAAVTDQSERPINKSTG